MAGEAITSKELLIAADEHLSRWREFRRGHDIGHVTASSIEVDLLLGQRLISLGGTDRRAAPAEGILDVIVPDQPIRKMGFGAIISLDAESDRGYLGLGGLNFVSHDFSDTLESMRSNEHLRPALTTRFGVDAIVVRSGWSRAWHILSQAPVYTTDSSAQKMIDKHFQHAEPLTTEDRMTLITPELAHVYVVDGESLLSTDWITAHDIAVANDIINREAKSGLENRGSSFYKAIVRHFLAHESAEGQDASSFMEGLSVEYGVDFSLTSTTHLFDRYFDENKSQIVISRAGLTDLINGAGARNIEGLGPKGLEVLRLITDESMHLRRRKY